MLNFISFICMGNKSLGHDGLICFLGIVRPLITMISFLCELRHRSPSRRFPPRALSPVAEPSPAGVCLCPCRATLLLLPCTAAIYPSFGSIGHLSLLTPSSPPISTFWATSLFLSLLSNELSFQISLFPTPLFVWALLCVWVSFIWVSLPCLLWDSGFPFFSFYFSYELTSRFLLSIFFFPLSFLVSVHPWHHFSLFFFFGATSFLPLILKFATCSLSHA